MHVPSRPFPLLAVAVSLVLALAACDSAPPTVGVVQVAVRSTPTPTPVAGAVSEPSPAPGTAPAPATTPDPASAPVATPTATPAPTPTPTPTAEEIATAHLSQTVPWVGSPPDALHRQAAESIVSLWVHDAELGDSVARMAWVVDGPNDGEAGALVLLSELAMSESMLTGLLVQLPWVADMPTDAPGNVEWSLFRLLLAIGLEAPELARLLVDHRLLAADVTHEERNVMELLADTSTTNLELAMRLAATDWVSDGIERHELRLLSALLSTGGSSNSSTEFLLGIPALSAHLTGDLRAYVTRALTELALGEPGHFEQVTAQRWFADGLTEEEAVLIVILERASEDSPALFRDLLAGHFSQTRTAELPFTGTIQLWVVQNSPFSDGGDILQTMEDTVRYLEELVQEPFPTNVLILSVVDPREEDYGLGGEWLNTHMRLTRDSRSGAVEEITHEAGHFIFKGQRWYSEGASELGRAFVNHRTGGQTIDQRRAELATNDRCARYANIRHWDHQVQELGPTPGDLCPYILGESLLLNAWNLLGQDNVSAALGELHVLDRDAKQPVTDELIFDVFLRNTPVGKEREFRDLYHRLHGGAFALQVTDFSDDHGDEPASASLAEVGRSVTGTLDYVFDFDYFRFQAQKDQKYRITLQHPSLSPDWLAIYAPDGATQETQGVKSRSATPSGPEVLWTASSTGEHYVAVRNFGGLTGAYSLSIDPVEDAPDDHGDTSASATSLAPGQTVNGAVDDGFDFDYFRFQAEQGQWVHVEIGGGTLEFLNVGLYEADGTTPALQRPEDVEIILSGGGAFVDVIALDQARWFENAKFDWISPGTGEFLLTVSGAEGRTGTYTVTVTMPER